MIRRHEDGRYDLTEWGRESCRLLSKTRPMGRAVDARRPRRGHVQVRWLHLPLELIFGGTDPGRSDSQAELRTAGEVLTVESTAGRVEVRSGPATSPDVVASGVPELIIGLMSGALDKDAAVNQGVSILGDSEVFEQLRRNDWLTPPTEEGGRHLQESPTSG